MKATKPSVDHFTHLSFIKDIKLNNNRFILKNSNVLEDKNFMYPQFMHFILSFLPDNFLETKYLRINFILEILLYGFATFTVIYFSDGDWYKIVGMVTLLIVTNPFNRFVWNAKVSGISARNFGILTTYIYLFYFASNFFQDNIYLRLAGFVLLSFLIIISSQFATQFLLLFSIINLFLKSYYPAVALPLSFLLFYLIMPKVFLSYLRGQYQHKKIWIRHLAKIDLLKNRPSVYRDFVYDFFKRRNFKYFLTNPVIEVITGFPLIVLLVLIRPEIFLSDIIIFSAVACFILTSFRFSRFFGEPQRYVEMALPMLVLAAIKYLPLEVLFCVIIFNLIFFVIHINKFEKFNHEETFNSNNREKIKAFIYENSKTATPILLGNNWSMPGYFLPEKKMKIMIPTFTNWNQYGESIDKIFPEQLFCLDRDIALKWIKNYKPGWFFLDAFYWPISEFEEELTSSGIRYSQEKTCEPILLYQITYE